MPLDLDIQDGANALDNNQLQDALDGTYWKTGWDASLGAGDLEVDIAAGTGVVGTIDIETTSTETVDFTGDVDPDDPRKAIISFDDTGTVQKTLGDPEQARPTNQVREKTYTPAPPASVPGVAVAEVWLADGATALASDDLRDRRISNNGVESVGTTSGIITMWSGAISEVPDGWTLCDGTDGTPDLTDRFVTGAGGQYNVGDTGGEDEHTLTESELPAHDHPVSDPGHNHDYQRGDSGGSGTAANSNVRNTTQDQTSTETTGISVDNAGGGQSHENRPPYYALAYIQKV